MYSKYTKLVCGCYDFFIDTKHFNRQKSAFLGMIISSGFLEDEAKAVQITPPDMEIITGAEALEIIMRHCYGGPANLLRDSVCKLARTHGAETDKIIIDMLLAACYYQSDELIDECVELIESTDAVVPGKNLCDVWEIAGEMLLKRLWLHCYNSYRNWTRCSVLRLGCAPSPIKKLQIAFCIDTTGSMGACLGQLRVKSYSMLETIFSTFYKPEDSSLSTREENGYVLPGYYSFSASLGAKARSGGGDENIKMLDDDGAVSGFHGKQHVDDNRVQFAALSFGDYCDGTPIKFCHFCKDYANVSKFINRLVPAGGGPTPEAYEWAMRTAHERLEWDMSRSCAKVLIVVGDSYPHPPSYTTQGLYWRDEAAKLAQDGVKVFGVCAAGSFAFSVAFMREVSRITGGVFIDLGSCMGSKHGWGTLCEILESATREVKREYEKDKERVKEKDSCEYKILLPSDDNSKVVSGMEIEREEDPEAVKEMAQYQINVVGPLMLQREVDEHEDSDDDDDDDENDFIGADRARHISRWAEEIQREEWWDVRNDSGNTIFEPTSSDLILWKRIN